MHENNKSSSGGYLLFHLSMDCFWAEVKSGQIELKEAEDARWLTAEQLDEVKWLPADLELIDPIRQMLAKSMWIRKEV